MASSIKEFSTYLETTPTHRKQRLRQLIDLIDSVYPQSVHSMKYNMPSFHNGDGWVAVANQKHYISLYTCGEHHLREFKSKHPGIKTGKGCINFKDSDTIPVDDIRSVINNAMSAQKPQ